MNPGWLPTEDQIRIHIAEQRRQRERLAQRVDDSPQTILMPIDKPARRKAPEFIDSFPPAEEYFGRTAGFKGFIYGMTCAGVISALVFLYFAKVPV